MIDLFDFAAAPSTEPTPIRGARIGPPIGARGRRILIEIKRHVQSYGYGPTVRELAKGAGISSTSVTDFWLRKLRAAGYVTYTDAVARTIRTTGLEPPR